MSKVKKELIEKNAAQRCKRNIECKNIMFIEFTFWDCSWYLKELKKKTSFVHTLGDTQIYFIILKNT